MSSNGAVAFLEAFPVMLTEGFPDSYAGFLLRLEPDVAILDDCRLRKTSVVACVEQLLPISVAASVSDVS